MAVTLLINNNLSKFNASRIMRVLNASSRKEALYMGFWDRFKDYFNSGAKLARVEALLDLMQIHPNQEETNETIKLSLTEKFAYFVQIKELADDEYKNLFFVSIEPSKFGNGKIKFIIEEYVIYQQQGNSFHNNFIRKFLMDCGQIKDNTSEATINQQFLKEQQAALNIQTAWKKHVDKRLEQGTKKVKEMCLSTGTLIKEYTQIKVGDILLLNRAEHSRNPLFWNKHGYICQVKKIQSPVLESEIFDETLKYLKVLFKKDEYVWFVGNDVVTLKKLELNSDEVKGEVIVNAMQKFKFRESEEEEFESLLKFFILQKSIFRLNNFDFNEIQSCFHYVAQNHTTKAKKYSRQYNCNNVVHDTLKMAISERKKKKVTLSAAV